MTAPGIADDIESRRLGHSAHWLREILRAGASSA
jgi:hypothetical protein